MKESRQDPRLFLAERLSLSNLMNERQALERMFTLGEEEVLYWISKCSGTNSERSLKALSTMIGGLDVRVCDPSSDHDCS